MAVVNVYPLTIATKILLVKKTSKIWAWVIEKKMKRKLLGFPVPKMSRCWYRICGTYLAKES